jgi:hypothetical protein
MRELLSVQKAPFQISKLAKAPLNQLEMLPAAAGIYFAIDDASRVWYVGLAISLRDRLKTHPRMVDFKTWCVTAIAWKEVDEAKCADVERAAIEFFGPPLNLQNNNAFPRAATGLSPDEEIERYLRLKLEAKWIVLELESLKPNIVSHCQEAGGEVAHPLGTVQMRPYPSWQFSSAVEEQQQKLTDLRKQEQDSGLAVRIEKTAPCVRLNRNVLAEQIAVYLTPLLEIENDAEEAANSEESS